MIYDFDSLNILVIMKILTAPVTVVTTARHSPGPSLILLTRMRRRIMKTISDLDDVIDESDDDLMIVAHFRKIPYSDGDDSAPTTKMTRMIAH